MKRKKEKKIKTKKDDIETSDSTSKEIILSDKEKNLIVLIEQSITFMLPIDKNILIYGVVNKKFSDEQIDQLTNIMLSERKLNPEAEKILAEAEKKWGKYYAENQDKILERQAKFSREFNKKKIFEQVKAQEKLRTEGAKLNLKIKEASSKIKDIRSNYLADQELESI